MIPSLIIIPVLGMCKNYVKYKRVSLLLFLRTPFIYIILYTYMKYFQYKNIVSNVIINERVFMFLYKIFRSLLIDSYHKKKKKYIKKYNILYNSDKCLEKLTD